MLLTVENEKMLKKLEEDFRAEAVKQYKDFVMSPNSHFGFYESSFGNIKTFFLKVLERDLPPELKELANELHEWKSGVTQPSPNLLMEKLKGENLEGGFVYYEFGGYEFYVPPTVMIELDNGAAGQAARELYLERKQEEMKIIVSKKDRSRFK